MTIKRTWTPSDEQQAIWDAFHPDPDCPDRHLIIRALAGTGKTTTIVEAVKETLANAPLFGGPKIGICAFNTAVEKEIEQMVPRGVQVKTTHKLLFRILRESFPSYKRWNVDRDKTFNLLDYVAETEMDLHPFRDFKSGLRGLVNSLTSKLKNRGVKLPDEYEGGPVESYGTMHIESFQEQLDDLASHHGIDYKSESRRLRTQTAIANILWYGTDVDWCMENKYGIDYDDMLYLPYAHELEPTFRFDILAVDESQDLNPIQIYYLPLLARRIAIVGDEHQAIYGWRGADAYAMRTFQTALETTGVITELPLTINRRCPTSIIELAQQLVPDIRPCEDAPIGKIFTIEHHDFLSEVREGDMVLCRTNAPMISCVYTMWRQKKRAYIRGRQEFASSLVNIVKAADTNDIIELEKYIADYEQRELERIAARKLPKSSESLLLDKIECLRYIIAESNAKSVKQVFDDLYKLFDDINDKTAVQFSSFHRAKGLECFRVFIYEPSLVPHHMATQPWELDQELNIAYVGVTRVKFDRKDGVCCDPDSEYSGQLYFVGSPCPAFPNPISNLITYQPPQPNPESVTVHESDFDCGDLFEAEPF